MPQDNNDQQPGAKLSVPLLLPRQRPVNTRKRLLENVTEPLLAEKIQNDSTKIFRRDQQVESGKVNEEDLFAAQANKLEYHFGETGTAATLKHATLSATAEAEHDTEVDRDHRAIREAASSLNKESLSGNYLGRSNYFQYISRQDTTRANALSDKNFRAGPMRMATNIRNTCRFDYAPDLCKDYNETGFCGFGDSCKFVHDRGDYKAGWELDNEWEEQQQRLREGRSNTDDYYIPPEEQKPNPPEETKCGICGKDFTKPALKTKCGHFFCEKCAISSARNSKKCDLCGTIIDGQFRVVKNKV